MESVEDVKNRILVCGQIVLPRMMGKIDVLSPVLELEDREEDFVLDLHYSLRRKRTWEAEEVRCVAGNILEKLLIQRESVVRETAERLSPLEGESVIRDWNSGLEMLAEWRGTEAEIYWERRPEDDLPAEPA